MDPQLRGRLTQSSGRKRLDNAEPLLCKAIMLALHQADRRADALAAYARATGCSHRAGIEPCSRFQEAHRQLLAAEPTLGRWVETRHCRTYICATDSR